MSGPLLPAALAVFLLNLPFGFWRSRSRRLSVPWFLAIHLPVPLVVGIRVVSGLGFRLSTFPILIGAFFLGQWAGGWMGRR